MTDKPQSSEQEILDIIRRSQRDLRTTQLYLIKVLIHRCERLEWAVRGLSEPWPLRWWRYGSRAVKRRLGKPF